MRNSLRDVFFTFYLILRDQFAKFCFAFVLSISGALSAQVPQEYYVSPNEPLPDLEFLNQEEESSLFETVLLYIPNRFLDLVDIFKADVGVGPSLGAVVRVTKYGQVGIRSVAPLSARLGLMGRRAPAMLETSSEIGIGPAFIQSKDRKVCWGELGAGLDLLLLGGYLGFCPDEFVDFVGGIFLFDLKDDDLH